jgi:hypothetical protein
MDLIYANDQKYVVLREARKDELSDEISYHLIVYQFNNEKGIQIIFDK